MKPAHSNGLSTQLENAAISRQPALSEVVLVLRPLCSPVKVDQGFISGCHSHRLCFARIGLVGGQDAMGRVRSFGIVIGQPFSDAAAGL